VNGRTPHGTATAYRLNHTHQSHITMKKIFAFGAALIGLTLPVAAFADGIWETASTTAALSTAYAALGVILALAIGAIIGAWASLHGLGYGVRKAKKHAVGRAF